MDAITIKYEQIKLLVNIGLNYNVDYIYILEDIKKILEGKIVNIQLENYLDD